MKSKKGILKLHNKDKAGWNITGCGISEEL